MSRTRMLIAIVLLMFPAMLGAQTSDENRGWSFSERLQGTSNDAGLILKLNSTVGFRFNSHIQAYTGLPVYFVRESSSTTPNPSFEGGIGNAYLGLLGTTNLSSMRYSSDLMFGAPTGDRSRGFSTGHATIDWTNTFSHSFHSITPYASVGAGNSLTDTSFFVRPFTTNGAVEHGEAGALVDVAPHLSVGGSFYAVRAQGTQEVASEVVTDSTVPASNGSSASGNGNSNGALNGVTSLLPGSLNPGNGNANGLQKIITTQTVTTTTPDLINDHGYSGWVSVKLNASANFQIGYSRSASYQFNSLFFGIGTRIGH